MSMLVRVVASALVAITVVWAAGVIGLDTVSVLVWNESVGSWLLESGREKRLVREGSGTTRVGELGVVAPRPHHTAEREKVVVWGDSHVLALQVDDDAKMHVVLEDLWRARSPRSSEDVWGIGQAGYDLVDFLFLTPQYRPHLGSVSEHLYVIGDVRDVDPYDEGEPHRYHLADRDAIRRAFRPPAAGIREPFRRFEAASFWQLARLLNPSSLLSSLRFTPGPVAEPSSSKARKRVGNYTREELDAYWDWILAEISREAGGHGSFVYLPKVPTIRAGEIVLEDEHAKRMEAFGAACRRHGLGYLDATDAFVELYRKRHVLPRGFPNTVPGRGHLNEEGHRAAAELMLRFLQGRVGAVQPG